MRIPSFRGCRLGGEISEIPACRKLSRQLVAQVNFKGNWKTPFETKKTHKANFNVMYGETPVKISQIKHKATLEVDEMGSVASAATAVEIQKESLRVSEPPQIRFDRPFLVLIRENTTGTNLFMGRINNPTAK